MMKKSGQLFCFCFLPLAFLSQPHNLFNSKSRLFPSIHVSPDTDLVFNRSRGLNDLSDTLPAQIKIGGYVSSYYASNDDDRLPNGFVQFPTLEPRKDQFSLNMALISLAYESSTMRGNITLHYGDVPESSWPKTFNLIQEANGGFRVYKKIWLDAGFFKTHIGIESFQPRENIASSMSIMNFYDPYFLSGAKLSYLCGPKLTFQVSVFNGYNEYLDNNKNKAFGFTAVYNPTRQLSLTYNALTCDETPDKVRTKHQRFYQNIYSTLHLRKLIIGVDLNFGVQQHSLHADTTKAGFLYGALIVAKYQFLKKLGAYGRAETFSDPNQILTGTLDIGHFISGTTLGLEFKPQRTVSLSTEWRILQADNLIFLQGNKLTNRRNEFNLCLDLWF